MKNNKKKNKQTTTEKQIKAQKNEQKWKINILMLRNRTENDAAINWPSRTLHDHIYLLYVSYHFGLQINFRRYFDAGTLFHLLRMEFLFDRLLLNSCTEYGETAEDSVRATNLFLSFHKLWVINIELIGNKFCIAIWIKAH